jgi:hypothetical protein
MNLQWYNLIPFIILFQIQKSLISFKLPTPSENVQYLYSIFSLLCLLFILVKSNSNRPIEEVIVILSFVAIQKISLNAVEIKGNTNTLDRDLFHPLVITCMLVCIKHNIIDYSYIKYLYAGCLFFSSYALYATVKPIDTLMLDYFVVHSLFYFLKN